MNFHGVGDDPRMPGRVRVCDRPGRFVLLQDDSLQIRFDSPEALRDEFERNISNRGIFVATEQSFEVRRSLDIEIVLSYVDDEEIALSLRGEVVHCIPPEMAPSGVEPGVAIQFDDTASELREAFEPLLSRAVSVEANGPCEADAEGRASESSDVPGLGNEPSQGRHEAGEGEEPAAERRSASRGAVRVPVRIMPTMSPPFEATSRDLSATGILLSMKKAVLPVGEIVRICLWHPSGEPSVEIDGQVVRQVPNKKGRIAAVAVAFDRNQAADPRVREVIDALREAGHRSRLGGISGSIVDLGLANMLQMFGSSAREGTLVVEREGEQGWIAFAEEELLGAELGELEGQDALVAMLDWGDGRFQFEATADPTLLERAERRPLAAAVLAAVCALDELVRDEVACEEDEDEIVHEMAADEGCDVQEEAEILRPVAIGIVDSTTFEVDLEQEEASRSALDKTEEAVLDLARAGMPMEKLISIIPEAPEQVQAALEGLVDLGVLCPR